VSPAKSKYRAHASNTQNELRERILMVAGRLLTKAGRDGITTRAVAEAAGVQPPVLYRLFKDKDSLLDALAEHAFVRYLAKKQLRPSGKGAIDSLRAGWDLHVEFGLLNPALYLLMYAEPRKGGRSPAAEHSFQLLRAHIRDVAAEGRLRISEKSAAHLYHASALGTVLSLLNMAVEARDMSLSNTAREAALAAILTDLPTSKRPDLANAAITLRALLDDKAPLSPGERRLLVEWLDRLAEHRTEQS
jgi:AcrR family transcriptional regulator